MASATSPVEQLIEQLKSKTGYRGSNFYQCRQIAHLMAYKNYFVSAHTIGRLLGVVKPPRKTYVTTLNLIAQFLGYEGWDHFERLIDKNPGESLISRSRELDPGFILYSQACYAFDTEKYALFGKLLDRLEADSLPYKWLVIDHIGLHCRSIKYNPRLFRFLAEHPVARDYFYRTFVDEDDASGYFSDNLRKYFWKTSRYVGDQIYACSFIVSKSIYNKAGNANPLLKEWMDFTVADFLGKDVNDYHIISRLFELRINLDKSRRNVEKIVDSALELEPFFKPNDYAWIIGRILRSLYYNRYPDWASQYQPLSNACEKILIGMPGGLITPGDLFVQLNYFSSIYKESTEPKVSPRRAKDTHLSRKECVILDHLLLSLLERSNAKLFLQQSLTWSTTLRQFWAPPFIRSMQKLV